jgi:hypothetical protein
MTDTETTVTSKPSCSTSDRSPPFVVDPVPGDLDRLAASLDDLELSCCEPAKNKSDQPSATEATHEDEQFLVDTVSIASEQIERMAMLDTPSSIPSLQSSVAPSS